MTPENKMLKGRVDLSAQITGLKFPAFDFNPNEPGIEKINIGCEDARMVTISVFISAVDTAEHGAAKAVELAISTLDRLAFHRNTAIGEPKLQGQAFEPVIPQPGIHVIGMTGYIHVSGNAADLIIGLPAEAVRPLLETKPAANEQYFRLYRAALNSMSPVEEYMHVYNLLLMLFNDKQPAVDEFILREEPSVAVTPRRKKGLPAETHYTRLRNQFGHARAGTDIKATKAEMVKQLGNLRELTKKAILQHP